MEMDEIYKKIYKNEAEKESDQIELQMFDVENNEMGEVQKYIVLQPIDIFKQCLTTINIVSL